jgi:hypothetical protein
LINQVVVSLADLRGESLIMTKSSLYRQDTVKCLVRYSIR